MQRAKQQVPKPNRSRVVGQESIGTASFKMVLEALPLSWYLTHFWGRKVSFVEGTVVRIGSPDITV